ncbi:MAG: class I SAM-dependent methyltransferase [Pirellula sp.]
MKMAPWMPWTIDRRPRIAFGMLLCAVLSVLVPACCMAQDKGAEDSKPPAPLKKYMGRRIAVPMSYHGIPWLNRPERIQEENPEEMLTQLEVKPGMVVCDMGCGDGYYTMELAKRVGPEGKVYAVDIQPEMLQELSRRCERFDLKNVDAILGEPHDPKLPEGKIDLILMVDVYHEFSNPVEMLTAMRRSLKPDGVIALVEFRGEDPQVPIKPEHKMTKKQILDEYRENRFRLVRQYDRLPWQHLMFLGPEEAR